MRDLRHDNLNDFIGARVSDRSFIIVTEYCTKGSLQVSHASIECCTFESILEGKHVSGNPLFRVVKAGMSETYLGRKCGALIYKGATITKIGNLLVSIV